MISSKTVTSIFMVPTLGIDKEDLSKNNFINAYSDDINNDASIEDSVFLLFKPKDLVNFKSFLEKEYEKTKKIIEDYDYEDGYVVVVYNLDDKYKEDFDKIREGKYSTTSIQFQNLFNKTVRSEKTGNEQETIQYLIFTKDIKLLDFWEEAIGQSLHEDEEIWPEFNIVKETLDIKNIKK